VAERSHPDINFSAVTPPQSECGKLLPRGHIFQNAAFKQLNRSPVGWPDYPAKWPAQAHLLEQKDAISYPKIGIPSSEDDMSYRITILSVFAGIAIGSLCIGQGKPTVKSQVTSDVKMSDHDRIERLLGEVAELKKKLTALTKQYETHTHQIRNLTVAQMPGSMECDQTVVRWSSPGINPEPVYKTCRQLMSGGNIGVLVPGKESTGTGTPLP
jgi:hypothetical protein